MGIFNPFSIHMTLFLVCRDGDVKIAWYFGLAGGASLIGSVTSMRRF